MDEHLPIDPPTEPVDEPLSPEESFIESASLPEAVEVASSQYVGQWNRLVSTTNWEKGRIVSEWRQALIEADAPTETYTDEAWSQRLGNITPQHVGRLRRVFDKFGSVHDQYAGLYWSHFQASLDWPDAEMWLEGAVQNGWSISQTRQQRWDAIGAPPDKKPRDEDIVTAELDEDVLASDDGPMPERISPAMGEVHGEDMPNEGELTSADDHSRDDGDDQAAYADDEPSAEPVRPFADLGSLPDDLNEAFEAFKLGILHHKLSGWRDVSCDDVLAVLSALRELALAPSDA